MSDEPMGYEAADIQSPAEAIAEQREAELLRLIDWAGNGSNLARILGISRQEVSNWKKRKRISTRGAIMAEKYTNGQFTVRDLLPQLEDFTDMSPRYKDGW